jgi:hypothetical protein
MINEKVGKKELPEEPQPKEQNYEQPKSAPADSTKQGKSGDSTSRGKDQSNMKEPPKAPLQSVPAESPITNFTVGKDGVYKADVAPITKTELSEEEIETLRQEGFSEEEIDALAVELSAISEDEEELEEAKKGKKKKDDDDDYDDKSSCESEELEDEGSIEESVAELFAEKMGEIVEFELEGSELGSLLESDESLSGEFKEKAVVVFEAAVRSTAQKYLDSIIESAVSAAQETVMAVSDEMGAIAEAELENTIAEWMEENKVELQSNARLQLAESFMGGLKDLFEQHHIEIPEQKQDIFEEVVAENDQLSATVVDSLEANQQLAEENLSLKKELAVEKFVAGMTDLKAEKFRDLAEGIDFDEDLDFGKALETLNENYFGDSKPAEDNGDSTVNDMFLAEDEDGEYKRPTSNSNEAEFFANFIEGNY